MHNVQQGQELASILQRTWDLRELAAASHLFEHMLAQPGSTAILLPRVYNLVVFKTFPPCRQLAHMMPNVECLTVPGNSTIGRFGVPFETATLEVELDRLWPNLRALVVDYMTPVRLLSCEHHMSHLEVSFEPPHPRPYHLWRATEPVIEPSMTLTHLVLKSTHPPQQFTSAFFQALPALRVLEVGLHVALTSLGPMRMGVGVRSACPAPRTTPADAFDSKGTSGLHSSQPGFRTFATSASSTGSPTNTTSPSHPCVYSPRGAWRSCRRIGVRPHWSSSA